MKIYAHAIGLAVSLVGPGAAAEELWSVDGFDMPESAIVDVVRDRVILSTIRGNPAQADGNGGLALLSREGAVLDPDWTSGLDAPKGMAIVDNLLLVADLTRLHEIDLATGEVLRSIDASGALFLNDITSDGDVAYISDLMTHSLWRYERGALSLWLTDARLSHPNGLYWDSGSGQLLVGSWGDGMREDFSTDTPGSLLAVDPETQAIRVVAPEIGNIDGIARIGDTLLVDDWMTGQLFEIDAQGIVRAAESYPAGLADIAAEGNTLYLPMMLEGRLVAREYP